MEPRHTTLFVRQALDGDGRFAGRVAGKKVYHRAGPDAPGRVLRRSHANQPTSGPRRSSRPQ